MIPHKSSIVKVQLNFPRPFNITVFHVQKRRNPMCLLQLTLFSEIGYLLSSLNIIGVSINVKLS